MKTVLQAHDRFFKAALSDLRVAQDFLTLHLPEAIREAIEWDSLKLCPNSYVDKALKLTVSDVLYQARLKEAKESVYLYVLCEHQSTVDPLMAFRIWQYVINIWADVLKQAAGQNKPKQLPLIVPLLFYTGGAAYTGSQDLRELIQAPPALIDQALFKQTFQLIDVNHLSDDELQRQQWAGMLAFIMKHIHARDILVFLKQIMGPLQRLEQAGGTDFIVLLLNYCLNTGETLNVEEFVSVVQQGLSPQIGEKVMTIAEQLIQKGKLEGIAEGEIRGEIKGELKGQIKALNKIAVRAFKQGLALSIVQQLTGLSIEELQIIQKKFIH